MSTARIWLTTSEKCVVARENRQEVRVRGDVPVAPLNIRMRPEQLGVALRDRSEAARGDIDSDEDGEVLQGVYIISVAARLLAMHPQTLRKYERLGLVRPSRTIGMLRLYSEEDIQKLRLIRHLEENLGLNLAGVEFTLRLLSDILEMRARLVRAKEAARFRRVVEREMAQLLRRLNLTLQE